MTGRRPGLLVALVLAAMALVAATGLGLATAGPGLAWAAFAAAGAVGALALAVAWTLAAERDRAVARLALALDALAAAAPGGPAPERLAGVDDPLLEGAYRSARTLAARPAAAEAAGADRLAAVLATLPEAMVAITESGLVSLVNGPARALLGEDRIAVGTSAFDALRRTPVAAALARARAAEGAVEAPIDTVDGRRLQARVADFGAHGGAILCFAPGRAGPAAGPVEHALDLHDRPPAPAPFGPATPLVALPVLVLDTETTGLDPAVARVVSVGAVRLHGRTLYRGLTIDRLVRPDIAIPVASSRIHGITDAMVAEAPAFADVLPELAAMGAGTVVVGHNIGFDLAVIAAEAARAGRPWTAPDSLDTLLLAAALEPDLTDLNLESLAARHAIQVTGRHTALGDALVTAELYLRLLPRLAARGVDTLGAAVAFAGTATRARRLQARAGW